MLNVGDTITFYYLKEIMEDLKNGRILTDYVRTSEKYSGKIVEVRDTSQEPVSQETIRRGNIKGRRSEILYTVELVNGDVKAFYDGRMVGIEVLPQTKRGIWKLMASAFRRQKPQTA